MTDQNPPPDPKDQDPGNQNPPPDLKNDGDPDEDEDGDEGDGWTPPDKATWEKLNRTAKRRDAELRRAQAALAEAKKGKEDDAGKDDPVAKANAKLIRAEFRTALAGAGITDRADQKDILDALNLAGIDVDEDGPDPDQVSDLIDTFRRVFGARGEVKAKPRTPRVDTRDRGGSGGVPSDPDGTRYQRILTGGRRTG